MAPRSSLGLLLPTALMATACARSLADRPCPCDEGWSCSPVSDQCVLGPATQLIDDMADMYETAADGPGCMNAFWYTYSDRTTPNSEPVTYETDAGYVSPAESANGFLPSSGGDAPIVGGVAVHYRRVSGGGEDEWGVGFGLDFVGAPPDGGPIPVNECPAGRVWDPDGSGKYMVPQPFDASDWSGIQFYARSFGGTEVPVEIHVDDDRTSPWGQVPLDAGGCNACNNSVPDASACTDSFSNDNVKHPSYDHAITFTEKWQLFHVRFSELHSGNWANNLSPSTPIHRNKIYNLHFQMPGSDAMPVQPFDVGVAYVSFFKE